MERDLLRSVAVSNWAPIDIADISHSGGSNPSIRTIFIPLSRTSFLERGQHMIHNFRVLIVKAVVFCG